MSTETENKKFAQIDFMAMLIMNAYLTPLEYQLFTVIKMEEFLGGGVCRLKLYQIKEKYLFKNKNSLSTAAKRLRLMKWIIKVEGGYICQTDFSKLVAINEESEKKLRKNEFLNQESGENDRNSSKKLRKNEFKTQKIEVLNLENLSFSGRNKEEILKPEEQPLESFDSRGSFAESEGARAVPTGGDVKSAASSSGDAKPAELPERKTPKTEKKPRKRKRDVDFENLASVCFLKRTALDRQTLTDKDRGMLNQNLKKLRSAGYDLSKIWKFEAWWKKNWRSGTARENYEPPRPDQIVKYWNVAMDFEQIVEEVKSNQGKPVWVKIGEADVDVSNNYDRQGNFIPRRLDEKGRREALETLAEIKQLSDSNPQAYGSYLDMRKWYLPEDWDWLIANLIGGNDDKR